VHVALPDTSSLGLFVAAALVLLLTPGPFAFVRSG
jgi:hypothetical protein